MISRKQYRNIITLSEWSQTACKWLHQKMVGCACVGFLPSAQARLDTSLDSALDVKSRIAYKELKIYNNKKSSTIHTVTKYVDVSGKSFQTFTFWWFYCFMGLRFEAISPGPIPLRLPAASSFQGSTGFGCHSFPVAKLQNVWWSYIDMLYPNRWFILSTLVFFLNLISIPQNEINCTVRIFGDFLNFGFPMVHLPKKITNQSMHAYPTPAIPGAPLCPIV